MRITREVSHPYLTAFILQPTLWESRLDEHENCTYQTLLKQTILHTSVIAKAVERSPLVRIRKSPKDQLFPERASLRSFSRVVDLPSTHSLLILIIYTPYFCHRYGSASPPHCGRSSGPCDNRMYHSHFCYAQTCPLGSLLRLRYPGRVIRRLQSL